MKEIEFEWKGNLPAVVRIGRYTFEFTAENKTGKIPVEMKNRLDKRFKIKKKKKED